MINPGHQQRSTRLHDHDPHFKAPYQNGQNETRRERDHYQNGQNSRRTKRKQRDRNGRHRVLPTHDDEDDDDDDMDDVEIVLDEDSREDSGRRKRVKRRRDKSRQRRNNKKNMLFGNPNEIAIPMSEFYMLDVPGTAGSFRDGRSVLDSEIEMSDDDLEPGRSGIVSFSARIDARH